ncbi:MAG: XRE family transcriptional regulator [Myxococcales bacterium]|nr:MAG: XRE family transcriptional regulator [Myxococcales bacterium]
MDRKDLCAFQWVPEEDAENPAQGAGAGSAPAFGNEGEGKDAMTVSKNKRSRGRPAAKVGPSFAEYKAELLKDPEVAAAYAEMGPEFEMIASLIELRRERGLSQEELAEAVGTRQPAIARIESGRYKGMSVATLEKLAKALKARLVIRFEDEERVG